MALIRATSGGGGTSNPCKIGTFSIPSGTQSVSVTDVGFKAKQIAIYFQGSNGTTTSAVIGSCRIIYDERYISNYQQRGIWTGANAKNIDSIEVRSQTTTTGITEVNSSGFKFYDANSGSTTKGTYYYFAIG